MPLPVWIRAISTNPPVEFLELSWFATLGTTDPTRILQRVTLSRPDQVFQLPANYRHGTAQTPSRFEFHSLEVGPGGAGGVHTLMCLHMYGSKGQVIRVAVLRTGRHIQKIVTFVASPEKPEYGLLRTQRQISVYVGGKLQRRIKTADFLDVDALRRYCLSVAERAAIRYSFIRPIEQFQCMFRAEKRGLENLGMSLRLADRTFSRAHKTAKHLIRTLSSDSTKVNIPQVILVPNQKRPKLLRD